MIPLGYEQMRIPVKLLTCMKYIYFRLNSCQLPYTLCQGLWRSEWVIGEIKIVPRKVIEL